MQQSLRTAPPQGDEVEALASLLGAALHFAPGGMRDWMATLGEHNFRAVSLQGRVVAGLGIVTTGQWFGGRSVPMAGLTAVGVAPVHRGTGLGAAMIQSTLEEIREQGVPLSALYPATLAFYRRAGYERAGLRLTYELPLAAIDVREFEPELIPAGPERYDDIYHAYETQARHSAGNLDRPAW